MIPVVPPKPAPKNKAELNKLSDQYKAALENQIDNIKLKGLNISKTALIAGGIAFGGYILFDLFFGEKNKEFNKIKVQKAAKNDMIEVKKAKDNWLISSIKGYILAFILGIAKEKLVEALQEIKKAEEVK